MKKLSTLFILLSLVAFSAKSQVIVFSTIDSARLTTAGGLSGNTPIDSGKTIQITGYVYGPNSYPTPNGQAFWLNDGTAGIKIYSKHVYTHYQTVADGDQITVVGTLNDFYGSAEVDLFDTAAADTIIFISHNTPDTPIVIGVNAFSTQTYGTLVQVNNVNMTTATAWAPVTGKHYFTCHAGGLYLYIDSFTNSAMFNHAQPQGMFNVVGIADDYSTTEFNLDPRSMADFIPVGTNGIADIADRLTAIVYPNPANTQINIGFGSEINQTVISKMFDITGKEVLSEANTAVSGDNMIHLNTSNLNDGLYVLEVRLGEKSMITKISVVK